MANKSAMDDYGQPQCTIKSKKINGGKLSI